jgi:hypothetical protein
MKTPPFMFSVLLVCGTSCGTGTNLSSAAPEEGAVSAKKPATTGTHDRETASSAPRMETRWKTSTLAFTLTRAEGTRLRCHGLFVSKDVLLSPLHCFPQAKRGDEIRLDADGGTAIPARIIGLVPAPSEEVEGVILARVSGGVADNPENPRVFPLPEGVRHPFPLTLAPPGESPIMCSPRRYNLGGLIAYDCPTEPAMSGMVVRSKDSKPFAIHLGRKGTVGYGLVLGRIQNEILAALGTATGGTP